MLPSSFIQLRALDTTKQYLSPGQGVQSVQIKDLETQDLSVVFVRGVVSYKMCADEKRSTGNAP